MFRSENITSNFVRHADFILCYYDFNDILNVNLAVISERNADVF